MAFELYETPLYNDPSLISLWRFEGNSTDSKGNYNGTDTSMTYGSGTTVFGQSAIFNGSTGYITIPSGMADFTNGVTMSVWAYPTSSVNYARFFDFGAASGAGGFNLIFYRIATSNTLSIYNGTVNATVDNAIINNEWHHYVGTIDLDGKGKLYRDGKLIGTGLVPLPPNSTRTTNFIGKSNWAGDALYAGYMDDAAIFTRALTDTEIQDLYNGTLTKYTKNSLSKYRKDRFTGFNPSDKRIANTPLFKDSSLWGYWKLDGNSLDSKASNNGTDTSMTYPNENDNFGNAAKFNGSTSHIQITNLSHRTNDFTYSWWTKWHTQSFYGSYFENGSWTSTLLIRQQDANTINIYSMSALSGSFDFSPVIGQWYHLAIVRSGNTMYLYVNGAISGSFAFSVDIQPATNMWFGASQHSSTQCIYAYMADVAIFTRALTTDEVMKIYYGFPKTNNLVDYKRLEKNTSKKQEVLGELTSPLQLDSCKLWIDVSKALGFSDGDAISALPDLSGNGNNLSQVSSGQNPIYKTDVINGLPTMRGTAAASTTWNIPWRYSRASGGTISYSGGYVIHKFTSSGTFTNTNELSCEYLIVAGGGGGGGGRGGGGGGGGALQGTGRLVAAGSHTVTVGGGGSGGGNMSYGSNGGNSSFNGLTAVGGGGGGKNDVSGLNGGCGGGAGGGAGSGSGGIGSQGYNGGANTTASPYPCGGGGGMGSAGVRGTGSVGGNGGAGITSSISGTSTQYAGGGGGGVQSGTAGVGRYGGGNGRSGAANGYAGTANTGGGGGGSGVETASGGAGGSGIVIIRYLVPTSTLFYLVRKTSAGRVLSGKNNNWLLGHHSSNKQQAYYEGWVDSSTGVTNTTDFNVYSGVMNSTSYLWENGQVVKQGSGGINPPMGLCIGYVGTSEFSDHDIGEIIGYNRVLSDYEIAVVNNYLLKKWGLDYNLALGKGVSKSWGGTHWYPTNGSNATANYIGVDGLASITIDLKDVYQVSRIDVMHYWSDGRTYYYNKTEVSADGVTWTTIYDSEVDGRYAETYKGKVHTFSTIPVRYVKNTLNGSSSNTGSHWVEIRVMGK